MAGRSQKSSKDRRNSGLRSRESQKNAVSAGEQAELELSPSERFGVNAANRLSGNLQNGNLQKRGSTQKALASITLGFEMFVIFLTGMTVYGLRVFDPQEIGIYAGLALCGVVVLALALMRRGRLGLWLGWLVQALLFVSAFWLPAILIVAFMFGGLWVFCMIKGAQIDRLRVAWPEETA
ncbi:MAG: DUF4233 domain-containing protein [Microbacteriaceae bacterium]|nr:DUF4233 domain-containing protein [Microbacteriaceae bacterium]